MRNLIKKARLILSMGDPLPVDLEAKLVAAGVDVDNLKRRYER